MISLKFKRTTLRLVGYLALGLTIQSSLFAQGFDKYIGKTYEFCFFVIPEQSKSIRDLHHSTFFRIDSDSTFVMGLSEAVETGKYFTDSTMKVKLYHYNSDPESVKWSESFKIILSNDDYLVLAHGPVNVNDYYQFYKGLDTIWFVYFKRYVKGKIKRKSMLRKVKKLIKN
jgi:hypothetical protein